MSPEPITAERAYVLLKADILSGRFRSGSGVIERPLAAEYGMSVSPLRDAAQRLVGEGFLETAAGGGYQIPKTNAKALRDLYNWHGHLVRLILKGRASNVKCVRADGRAVAEEADKIAIATTEMFRALALSAANQEHTNALISATDRLHAARRMESRILSNLDNELRVVENACAAGSGPDRFEVLWAYHRRRLRRAERIAMVLNAS
jgi:DNA-binding GntR family transcriptional regulator